MLLWLTGGKQQIRRNQTSENLFVDTANTILSQMTCIPQYTCAEHPKSQPVPEAYLQSYESYVQQ